MSFTTFAYANLQVRSVSSGMFASLAQKWATGAPSPTGEGSSAALWLHEPAFSVSFTVRNTGKVAGIEVSVPYAGFRG